MSEVLAVGRTHAVGVECALVLRWWSPGVRRKGAKKYGSCFGFQEPSDSLEKEDLEIEGICIGDCLEFTSGLGSSLEIDCSIVCKGESTIYSFGVSRFQLSIRSSQVECY